MKKSCLFVLVLVALILSSCLGDNENSYSGGTDFAVVKKSSTGALYVTPSSGVDFTWDGISKYGEGDALLTSSYKIKGTSGIPSAEYVNIAEDFPVKSQLKVTAGTADTLTNLTNKIGLTKIVATLSTWSSVWNDKWLVTCTYNQLEGEVYSTGFVYDKSIQFLTTGVALPANTVIVDVIRTRVREAIGTKEEKKTDNIVVDFSTLRSLVKPSSLTSPTTVTIYFRYSREGSNSTYTNYSSNIGGLYYPTE